MIILYFCSLKMIPFKFSWSDLAGLIFASFFFKFQQRTWKLKIKIIVKIILFTDNFKWKILTQVFLLKWARNFGILSLDVLRLKKYSQFRRRLTGKHSFWNLGHFLSLSFFYFLLNKLQFFFNFQLSGSSLKFIEFHRNL